MKAELARELGRCEEAVALIDSGVFSDDAQRACQIRTLALEPEVRVKELNSEDA